MKKILVPFLTLFASLSFAPAARADESCRPLIQELRGHLQRSRQANIQVQHLTNYQTDNGWLGGYTQTTLTLDPATGHLVGSGTRYRSDKRVCGGAPGTFGSCDQMFDKDQGEWISYDISDGGQVILSGQYGPYDAFCLGTKFLIVNTWDSIETFAFIKGFDPVIH